MVEAVADGNKSVVYRAQHLTLDSEHAIKVLTRGTGVDRERSMRAARAQANLRHDNIVEVTDVLEIEGRPCLVMPFISGGTLDDFLDDDPPMRERIRVFRDIVRGVREAHRQGMVHRDLKPHDILVDRATGTLVPKVADFNLVKMLEGSSVLTNPSVRMGEPLYTAPEQVRDPGAVDARADVFSLGCILYEVVTAQPAFSGGSDIEILQRMIAKDYARPSALRSDVLPSVDALIDGMLEPEPGNRIASADAVVDELKLILAELGRPPTEEVTSPSAVSGAPSGSKAPVGAKRSKPRRSNAGFVLVGVVTGLLVLGAVGALFVLASSMLM